MKYRLIVKPPAELDINEAAQWYDSKRAGLGEQFIHAVEEKLLLIEDNPNLYQVRYKATRLALIKRFPFAIHYTIEQEVVYVLAVLSTSRNPKIWED